MTPFWLVDAGPSAPSADGRGRVDVGIVGAGITGCSCALALAEAGLSVRVVDERGIAEGASGRNGGFALRGTAAPYHEVVGAVGRERALALWEWTEAELRALAEHGSDAFRPLGSLRLAADAEEREDLRDELEALRADGIAADWMGVGVAKPAWPAAWAIAGESPRAAKVMERRGSRREKRRGGAVARLSPLADPAQHGLSVALIIGPVPALVSRVFTLLTSLPWH